MTDHVNDYWYDLATRLLEEHFRQMRGSSGFGSGPSMSSPNMFTGGHVPSDETKGSPRRRYKRGKDGELVELPFLPAGGKSSKSGPRVTPRALVGMYNEAASILKEIEEGSTDGPRYYMVLRHYHECKTLEIVAEQMGCSKATAKQDKRAAMNQFVLLLKQRRKAVAG